MEDNSNVDIFINTHKDFKPKVSNPIYKVLDCREIKKSGFGDIYGHDDRFYSELFMMKYVADTYPLKDYVGFCHYRKYFAFMDNVPDIDKMFENVEAICSYPITFRNTIHGQYASYHNIEDLDLLGDIIKEKHPEYADEWDAFMNGHTMVPYNMFIMKKNDFLSYVDFQFGLIKEWLDVVGDVEKRLEDNKEKYCKKIAPNNSLEYQSRVGGYLMERLTTLFMHHHFKRIGFAKVIVTEKKYAIEKNIIKKP